MPGEKPTVDVLRINVDATTERLQLPGGSTATALRAWQEALGDGYLSPVYGEGWVALVDDEGLRKELELNVAATVSLRRFGWVGEVVGPMLVAGHASDSLDFSDLTEDDIELFEGIVERVRASLPG